MTDTAFRYVTLLWVAALATLLTVVVTDCSRFGVADPALVGSIAMGVIGSAGFTPLVSLPVRVFAILQIILFLVGLVALALPAFPS